MVNDGDRKPTPSASSAGPSERRGWTVARRLWLGVVTMAAVLTISGLISYWLVQRVEINLFRITEVLAPLEEAVLEMEINTGETAQTVLRHLGSPQQRDIDRMRDAEGDFGRFMKEFEQLAETDGERELGRKVAGIYRDVNRLGNEITSISDRRKVEIEIFRRDVEEMDALIDEKLQPSVDRTGAEGLTKLEASLDMEINIDEACVAIESYLLEPDRALLEKIADSEANFHRFEAQYRGTRLSADEEKWLTQIDKDFGAAVKMGGDLIALTDQLHEKLTRFESDLDEIDTILDEDVEPLIDAETQRAADDAHRSAQTLTTLTTVTGLLALIFVTGVTWNVTRDVVRSIRRLTAGVDRFGRGDFDHLIQTSGRGELGRLAVTLNEMARDLKQAEEALRELQENLLNRQRREKELVEAELAKTRIKLVNSTRLATLGQLTATVSHEIRNPLGTIRTAFYSVAEQVRGRTPLVDRALARAERSIVRCDRIIEDLLDYTRARESKPTPTEIDRWLGEVLDEQDVPEHITVTRKLAAGVHLAVDQEQLLRCVVNLVTNACQAMAETQGDDARLTVQTTAEDDRLLVSVGDTGCGIDRETMDRIFEPLYTTKGFGVGLGLPMVEQLMRQLGGGITVQSEPGKGTIATLWLPLPPGKKP